jgi:hypothetical protein
VKVHIEADITDELFEQFLYMIRVFDRANPDCHFNISAFGGEMSVEQMEQMFSRIGLPLVYSGRQQ